MNILQFVCITALFAATANNTAGGTCIDPGPAPPLDATNADKISFQRDYLATQAYLDTASAYLKCLGQEEQAASNTGQAGRAEEKQRLQTYNAAADNMRKVADNMKEQERKFKARSTP